MSLETETSSRHDPVPRQNGLHRLAEQVKTWTIVGTLATALWAGGYNWRGVKDLEIGLIGVRGDVIALKDETVRKDVLIEQLRAVTIAMDALRNELSLLRADHERERRRNAR